ncbi:MAG: glycosyltransferase family 2 protein [Pseudomonadota bacterium]
MTTPRFSVVIPCYNEADNIASVVAEALEATEDHAAQIIVVDDGSDDGTLDRLRGGRFGERLKAISHPRRSGKSAALRTGFRAASTLWVGTMDGDGQDNPADLVRMSQTVALDQVGEVGMVAGVRENRTDGGSRKTASRLANGLRKSLLNDDCPDTACGLKFMPRDLFFAMPFFDALHRYFPAFAQHLGFKVTYVSVINRPRAGGSSKYSNLGRAAAGFFDLMGVLWLMRRTHVPAPELLIQADDRQ